VGVLFCALSMGGVGYVTIRNADDNLAVEHERSKRCCATSFPPDRRPAQGTPGVIADSFSDATIMFVDIVGFTKLSEAMPRTLDHPSQ